MKKYLAGVALAVALVEPASAVTFPSLTTIYVGSGVFDDGNGANVGTATSIHCSNVSGVDVQVRVLSQTEVEPAYAGSICFSTSQPAP